MLYKLIGVIVYCLHFIPNWWARVGNVLVGNIRGAGCTHRALPWMINLGVLCAVANGMEHLKPPNDNLPCLLAWPEVLIQIYSFENDLLLLRLAMELAKCVFVVFLADTVLKFFLVDKFIQSMFPKYLVDIYTPPLVLITFSNYWYLNNCANLPHTFPYQSW